jgi:hypothetical protein
MMLHINQAGLRETKNTIADIVTKMKDAEMIVVAIPIIDLDSIE